MIKQAKQDLKNFMSYHLPSEGVRCKDTKRINTFIHSIHCLVLHVYYPDLKFFDYFIEIYSEIHKQLTESQLIILYSKIRKLANSYFNYYKKRSKQYKEQLSQFQKKINKYFSEENCKMLIEKAKA